MCTLEKAMKKAKLWFSVTDTCYILSFAIIMLNTSLHNPNVKDKPTLQRFFSMNRGINNGEDLPTELLTVSWLHYFMALSGPACQSGDRKPKALIGDSIIVYSNIL